jgi:DDE superfamily endonuclease/Helix-turn-helix of DDE superfamily endonuclease
MVQSGAQSVTVGAMLTYERLSKKPGAFQSMTGLSVTEFDALYARVWPRFDALIRQQTERADRQRAPGGGRRSGHALSERLLMTLVWLRLYVTGEAVGVLFGVDKATVSRFTRPILQILRELGDDALGWPHEAQELAAPMVLEEERPSPDAAVPGDEDAAGAPNDPVRLVTPDRAECPDYLAIIDATEQDVERAQEYTTQKRYYSGKRKSHTIKTQIVVNERGRIRHLSESVPGATHDLTLLRQSGVPETLPPGLTALGDTGYRGMQHDFPAHSVALPYRPKDNQRLTLEEKLHNHVIARLRVVVENTLCAMKHFRALESVFRHGLPIHTAITHAIAGLVTARHEKRLAGLPP